MLIISKNAAKYSERFEVKTRLFSLVASLNPTTSSPSKSIQIRIENLLRSPSLKAWDAIFIHSLEEKLRKGAKISDRHIKILEKIEATTLETTQGGEQR